jgi:hypothetical protein
VYKPSKATIKRWRCLGTEKKGAQAESTVNNQKTEDDLKILLRILSIITTITSLIHLRDQVVYVWTTLDTIRIRSPTSCRVIWKFAYSIGRSTYNPHLPGGFSFLSTREYRVSGVTVSEHRCTTIRGVGRRVVVHWGSLVYIYLVDGQWRRFDFGSSWTSVSRG